MSDLFHPGGNYLLCDICGKKVRASETSRRWDGMQVCKEDWEVRHPQDFVQGRRDRQLPAVVRSEAADRFVTISATVDANGIPSGGTPPDTSGL